VTAALAYADGIKVEGRYGDQVMYSLTDERVMYVPPIVRDKLIELGIGQNEAFSICKTSEVLASRVFHGRTSSAVTPRPTSGTSFGQEPVLSAGPVCWDKLESLGLLQGFFQR